MNFSIIIPTYNRAFFLNKTLKNLSRVNYPKNKFEIIVIDNNSNDKTKRVVTNFRNKNPDLLIKYGYELRQGHSFACNLGARKAKYAKLLFIDDDIYISKNILQVYAAAYKKFPKACIIGGKILAKSRQVNSHFLKNLSGKHAWVMGQIDLGNRRKLLVYPESILSGNMSINKTKFNGKPNIFNVDLGRRYKNNYFYGDDYELCLYALLSQHQVIYEPRAKVVNFIEDNRLNYGYVFRRYFFAGVEQFIIDKSFDKKNIHRIPLGNIDLNLKLNIKFLLKNNIFLIYFWLDLLINFIFYCGYFIFGPSYFHN